MAEVGTYENPVVRGWLYRDYATGHVAWFVNWWAALMFLCLGFAIFAGIVLVGGGSSLSGFVPENWVIRESSKTSDASLAFDVLEYGFGLTLRLLFRSGIVMCVGITVQHFAKRLFRTKKPKAA